MTKSIGSRAVTVGPSTPAELLQLRIDAAPAQQEPSEAARTHDDAVRVPWPIAPELLIDTALSNPWLGAITNLLADAIAGAPWELRAREVDVNGQLITRAPGWTRETDDDYARAHAWLSRENIGRQGVSELDLAGLLKALLVSYDQTGNLFVEVTRDQAAQEPLQLNHLLPQFVWYQARAGQLELYQLDPFRGEFSFVPFGSRKAGDKEAREFLHQREPNTASSYYGIPQWISARDSIAVDNEHRKYLKSFFRNHGTPRYIIKITQDPTWTLGQPSPDQLDSIFVHVQSFLSANAGDMSGRNLILQYPGGITVEAQPLDVKIEDPTFPNTMRAARDEILAVRHISLINLGLPEGGYRATAAQQAVDFQAQVLEPFSAAAVAIINKVIHAPAPSGLGVGSYDFALEFEGVDDLLARIEGVVKSVGGPVLSQVEGRQLLGYEAAGESSIFLPVNMIPPFDLGVGGPDAQDE